ncbi:RPAP1-like protein [Pestalotiopsis sp. NC0098]|nr:RPAP1-like protein [Pestalotiopsis sp. NC0098]
MDSPLIFDIQEKETSSPQAPSFPQIKSSSTGFPEHKKRTRISAFKQKRQGAESSPAITKPPSSSTSSSLDQNGLQSDASAAADSKPKPDLTEKQRIDRENSEKLANMTTAEIDDARSELFSGLDPKVLEMLLKRANLDEKHGPSPFEDEQSTSTPPSNIESEEKEPAPKPQDTTSPEPRRAPRKVHFEEIPDEDGPVPAGASPEEASAQRETNAQAEITPDAGDAEPPTMPHNHKHNDDFASSKPHWPHPPSAPDLDPSDPNFLSSLHEKYFPQLPADPTRLAWMAPIPTANSPADFDSPYHPTHSTIPVSELRFDFRGALLPPRIARAVPVTRGLHHHGEAPEAAGYTIKELARLARSAVPGQRCISYQTLGRILYRLGYGNFGGRGDSIPDGIWNSMVEGKVMESLYEEAGVDPDTPSQADGSGDDAAASGRGKGHRSAHAFAVEAIWLFEKGGWGEKLRKGK